MTGYSFSRAGLAELTSNFSTNLKNTKLTFDAIKNDFLDIEGKWQGGDSENATLIFKRIRDSIDKISANLDNADSFIKNKAEAFNNLRFHG